MIPPVLHDVHETAVIVKRSVSWLYKKGAAGVIPRTKIGGGVFWTDEQCARIIRDGAQEPRRAKQPKPREERQAEQKPKPQPPKRETKRKRTPPAANSKIPVADFSVSRLYQGGDAA